MRIYRIWLEDSVEPEGGLWCYGWVKDVDMLFHEFSTHNDDQLNTIEEYIEWGYKVELWRILE